MTTEIDTLTIAVTADTRAFETSMRTLTGQANSFSGAISRAFKDAVAGGKSFESVLSSLALKLAGLALDRALQPVTSAIGSGIDALFKSFGLARGGIVVNGAVRPFAEGGVVSQPTFFPLARGLGLMGEAGPEAVLPLARGADGTLGVKSGGAASVAVTFNVTTADAESFRKSEAQVTAMLARAVARGRRGL
jgi:lambda family phage tail tape measure protein